MHWNWILVGGTFDNEYPNASGFITKLGKALKEINPFGEIHNGGDMDDLSFIAHNTTADVYFWFPNISNDKKKILKAIKEIDPTRILVISKRNFDKKYDIMELIARALNVKANLGIEFSTETNESKIHSMVYDPLGNIFYSGTDIDTLAFDLCQRLNILTSISRQSVLYKQFDVPEIKINEQFLSIIKTHAETFHNIIHANNTSRFLGNCSFRCESGFPSFKDNNNIIWVSRRNIDKRDINENAFVPVKIDHNDIVFCSMHKPSVDTPIQVRLYNYYNNIKYILHSHCYIKSAYTTDNILPCGALEEFYEIIKCNESKDLEELVLNLNGHGSIVMSSNLDIFSKIEYISKL